MREVFEGLGFTNVGTVIGSGNVVFDSPQRSAPALEQKIEKALPEKLGFTSTTMVRTQGELEMLVHQNPFKNIRDEKPNYLIVTFFKDRRRELCTVLNLSDGKTPQFMTRLEREHGKAQTTRTWKTVHRILKRMKS